MDRPQVEGIIESIEFVDNLEMVRETVRVLARWILFNECKYFVKTQFKHVAYGYKVTETDGGYKITPHRG